MNGTIVFFLMVNPYDGAKPFRAVGSENIGAPWKFDESFMTLDEARDQLLAWISEVPTAEFHDLINT
jgi:hypothetical protein